MKLTNVLPKEKWEQFEKELFLYLRGANLYQRPTAHNVILDVGANPPDGISDQTRSACRIELLDGHHQTNVAFLDKVEHAQTIAAVFVGDLDDKAQIGADQTMGRLCVAIPQVPDCQVMFFGRAQQIKAVDLDHVMLKGVSCNR